MKTAIIAAAALLASVALWPAGGAKAQDCGGTYVVGEGETLPQITRKIYGPGIPFQILFSANSSVLVERSGVVAPGLRLTAPCLDGIPMNMAVLESEAPAPAPAPEPAEQAPLPKLNRDIDIRVVTADAWAPYTDAKDPNGGMLTEVINLALTRSAANPSFRIDFVNDWGAHLSPLIEDHLYDFSLAWVRPPCEAGGEMDQESRFRCEKIAWSEPVFEIVSQIYVYGAEEAAATTHASLSGKTICIPAGYTLTGLAVNGLMEPQVRLSRPRAPADCIQEVATGASDATFLTVSVAEAAIAEAGLIGQVQEAPQIHDIQTLHAITSVDHPRRDELLATINDGIRTIRENGEWFEIVQRHLVRHAAMTQ